MPSKMLKFSFRLCLLVFLFIPRVLSAWYEDLSGNLQTFYKQFTTEELPYKTHVFSEDPLIVYIENFITLEEASQLVQLSEPNFKPSVLWSDEGKLSQDKNYRSSVTASLGHDHQLVSLVTSRARAFPFYRSTGLIKPLVVQKYALGNQYKDHYDWFFDSPTLDGNIESTFFVYIEANCTGGGTNFPRLRWPVAGEKGKREQEELWCKWVDCERPWDEGVTFRPVTGNAIFWMNLKDGGRGEGDLKTLHAGLPVTSGTKMGLNIWTWTKKG